MSLQLHMDPSIAEHPQYKPLIENASRELRETIRPLSEDCVDATWKSIPDHPGRDLIVLTLRDEKRNTSAYFSPDDFRDRRDMELRFLHLWGNLLDLRLRDQISNLQGTLSRTAALADSYAEQVRRVRETVAVMQALLSTSREEIEKLRGADKDLRGDFDRFWDTFSTLQTQVAVVQAGLEDLKKRWEESERRRWTLYGLMIGATLTFIANLVLMLLRR